MTTQTFSDIQRQIGLTIKGIRGHFQARFIILFNLGPDSSQLTSFQYLSKPGRSLSRASRNVSWDSGRGFLPRFDLAILVALHNC